jgi:hypothetical protein
VADPALAIGDDRIIAHLQFARAVASRSIDPRCRGADREDLVAWGLVGLVHAGRKMQPLSASALHPSICVAEEIDAAATMAGQPQLRALQERSTLGRREPSTATTERRAIPEHRVPLKVVCPRTNRNKQVLVDSNLLPLRIPPPCPKTQNLRRVTVGSHLFQDVRRNYFVRDDSARPAPQTPDVAGPTLSPECENTVANRNFGNYIPEIVARNVIALVHDVQRRSTGQCAGALGVAA